MFPAPRGTQGCRRGACYVRGSEVVIHFRNNVAFVWEGICALNRQDRKPCSLARGVRQDLPHAQKVASLNDTEKQHEEYDQNDRTFNGRDPSFNLPLRSFRDAHNTKCGGDNSPPL